MVKSETFQTIAVTALAWLADERKLCWGDDIGRIAAWNLSR